MKPRLLSLEKVQQKNPVEKFSQLYGLTEEEILDLVFLSDQYKFSSLQGYVRWKRLCDYFYSLTKKRISPRQMKYRIRIIKLHYQLLKELEEKKVMPISYKKYVLSRA